MLNSTLMVVRNYAEQITLTCKCSGLFVVRTIGGVAPLDSVGSPVIIKITALKLKKLIETYNTTVS